MKTCILPLLLVLLLSTMMGCVAHHHSVQVEPIAVAPIRLEVDVNIHNPQKQRTPSNRPSVEPPPTSVPIEPAHTPPPSKRELEHDQAQTQRGKSGKTLHR